jgi:hypothetical protein
MHGQSIRFVSNCSMNRCVVQAISGGIHAMKMDHQNIADDFIFRFELMENVEMNQECVQLRATYD